MICSTHRADKSFTAVATIIYQRNVATERNKHMNRLHVELRIRALRAQLGDALRHGAPVIAMLRGTVAELERQTPLPDLALLRARLRMLYQDLHFSLLLRANPWLILPKDFFRDAADVVAPRLLSKVIVTADGRAGRISEVVATGNAPGTGDIRAGLTEDAAGRLTLPSDPSKTCASILCVSGASTSCVAVTAIAPLDGAAVMEAQAGEPPDDDGLFHGPAVAGALGLAQRHQGTDVTRRQSPIRVASDLQSSPLVLGQSWRPGPSRGSSLWRWAVPRR